ncbi:O-antigen ligase family protein [Paenibacillus guangzhouensis]|uniref:O-antigen ligase family protein n=1 Tax=Paenibacillus guangzhouensis TaxID=1473112 RepID=UPI00187B6AF1|nr:O-antigen ligase family protein [Paenibacillus guangzhouensis]
MSYPSYGKIKNTTSKISKHDQTSLIQWILMGVLALFLLWSPLWAALFNGQQITFERPLYEAMRWVAVIMLITGVYLFKNWRPGDIKDWYAILVFALPLTYLISLIPAASHYQALNMVYVYLIYAIIFVVGLYFTRNARDNSIIRNTLLVSTYFTVFFGLFHWFGNSKFIADVLGWLIPLKSAAGTYLDAVMTDSNGLRLTSFFQYANTYAAFLIAILFASAFLLVKSRKWYVSAIHAFMLVPIILSFFLTLSRAAYVILPVVFLIVILCLKPYRQIMYTVHMAIAFIASMAILNKVTTIGISVNEQFNGSESLKGWMLTLGVSLAVAILATLSQQFVTPWLQQKLNQFGQRKASSLIMPAAAVILGVVMVFVFIGTSAKNLLPENVKIRLENINFNQHSVLERGTFYKDAMKLVADYPVFGAGGGAWYSMYEKYQHNPYISRQAHSFFFQNIVEVGIVGFSVLVGLLILFFYTYLKNFVRSEENDRDSHFYYFIIAIALLIHSALDFDLSYVYVGVLLFLCLGAMLANIKSQESVKLKKLTGLKWAYPSFISVLALVMFIFAQMSLSANASFMTSLTMVQQQTSNDYNQIVTPLNKALGLRENPDYTQLKVQLLQSVYSQNQNQPFYDEAQSLLDKTLKKEPYNFGLISLQMKQYDLIGDKKKQLTLVEEQLKNFPWNMTLYENAIQLNINSENYDAALATYQKILDQKQVLASLPKEQSQGRAFDITPKTNLDIAKIYFTQANYEKASAFIKPLLTADYNDAVNKDMARYYVISLQKQGTTDQAVYDALVATGVNEKDIIDAIAADAK